MKYSNKIVVAFFMLILLFQLQATAQQQMDNSMSQYYQNRMLWNPAFTGADGNKIYAFQNRSWVGFDGAPVLTAVSGEILFGANSAAGLQIVSDVTGLLNRTNGLFNYAYRIKLSRESQLRIGITLSMSSDRLGVNYVAQSGGDPLLMNNINSSVQFDGNIGLVYTNKQFTLGASFFRLKDNLTVKSGGSANLAFAQFGGMYDITVSDKAQLKPLAMLRLYRTTDAIADLGMQFEYNKLLQTMLVYQTTGNIRAGAGVWLNQAIVANFFYNTNTKVTNNASQQFEVGVGFHLNGKKQD